MKPSRTRAVRLSLLALASTAALRCGAQPVEPGATTEVHDEEIQGAHASSDLDPLTAQRWIDEVRVGPRLDDTGSVPPDGAASRFSPEAAIHISMKVDDAPVGAVVRLVVHDALEQQVWSAERPVAEGEPYLHFTIGEATLPVGRYEARVIVGDERVAVRALEIAST
jgi:hypothetical protein